MVSVFCLIDLGLRYVMQKLFWVPMLTLGLTLVFTTGCGSEATTVVPAPTDVVDDMPGVDTDSAEYQKSMAEG